MLGYKEGHQSELLVASSKQPDVLHVHDWQSASVAPLLKVGSEMASGAQVGSR